MEIDVAAQTRTDTTETKDTLDRTGLDRDAFLKLFMAQLEHQDPLNPQDPTEMASQLAQFSEFEQSLRMVEELKGVNAKLDELIASSGTLDTSALELRDLTGSSVEFEGSAVRVPSDGSPGVAWLDLKASAERLGIEVRDATTGEVANVALGFTPLGKYELQISDGLQIGTPDGEFTPLQVDRSSGASAEPFFVPGHTYELTVGSTSIPSDLELSTSVLGTVSEVRNTSRGSVLVVNGQEVELSKLIGIR